MNADICALIAKYIYKPSYNLLDWINIDNINWYGLSLNPNAIDLVKRKSG
jgi:hypothetical protein